MRLLPETRGKNSFREASLAHWGLASAAFRPASASATAKRLVRGTSYLERCCFQLALLLPRSLLTETALALARGFPRLLLSFEISSAHL